MSRLHLVPELPYEPDPFTRDAAKVLGCWVAVMASGVGFWAAVATMIWRMFR